MSKDTQTDASASVAQQNPPASTDTAKRPPLWVRYLAVIAIGALVGLGAGLVVNASRADKYVATSTFALIPGASLPTTQGSNSELPPTDPGQLTLLTPVVAALTSDVSTSDVVAQRVGEDVEYTAVEQLIPNSPLLFSVRVTADTPESAVNVARTYQDVMTSSDKVKQSLTGSGAALRVVTSAIPPTKSSTPSSILVIAATGVTGAFIAAGGYWLLRNRRKLDVNSG
ncbi:hypothetical protein [Haematomicrobium sanguinis]|uniref:hypothetical protein n=1 Tax=Haematomicrobium sanguinis TaxID=479106 RepID=UPI00047D9624|nr:hypothetical protein [Haematomicrobium sanguinis]